MVAGVAAGLARYLGVDVMIIRLAHRVPAVPVAVAATGAVPADDIAVPESSQ